MYKVEMKHPDGTTEELHELFETEEEARAYVVVCYENYSAGVEVMQLMATNDTWDEGEDEEADFEVIEVRRK